MQTTIIESKVTALSSIHHGGSESFGIHKLFRREKFKQPGGDVEMVTIVSGNAMRKGCFRLPGMLHMCYELGFDGVDSEQFVDVVDKGQNELGLDDESFIKTTGLTLPAFHFLFSGGTLTSEGGKALDLGRARELKQLIPLVGILGGAVGNAIIPGQLDCGKLIPICLETEFLIPEKFKAGKLDSIYEYTQFEMNTRKDESKNDALLGMLKGEELKKLVASKIEQSESAVAGDVEKVEKTGQKQQMMYYTESICAGAEFFWEIILRDLTNLEREAVITAMAVFSRRPVIGGMARVGLGKVRVQFGEWFTIDSRLGFDGKQVAKPIGKEYEEHLKTNKEEIVKILRTIK